MTGQDSSTQILAGWPGGFWCFCCCFGELKGNRAVVTSIESCKNGRNLIFDMTVLEFLRHLAENVGTRTKLLLPSWNASLRKSEANCSCYGTLDRKCHCEKQNKISTSICFRKEKKTEQVLAKEYISLALQGVKEKNGLPSLPTTKPSLEFMEPNYAWH